MKLSLWVITVAVLLGASQTVEAACMRDNTGGEIAEGRLSVGQFEDAAGRPETAYILTLPVPTCLSGSDEMGNVEAAETIHVFAFDDALLAQLKTFVGRDVQVRGTPFGAHTAHHHAPIVMEISEIDAL